MTKIPDELDPDFRTRADRQPDRQVVAEAGESPERIALGGALMENARLWAENKRLQGELDAWDEHECVCDHDSGIDPDVLESATVIELKEQNEGLSQRLERVQSEFRKFRHQHELMDRDYREKAAELHSLRDPLKREGRERDLLTQIGVLQTQVFDEQAKLRAANVSLDNMRLSSGVDLTRARALESRHNAMVQLGNSGRAYAQLPPSTPPPPTYYERMRDEVNNTRASTVDELKRKVIGLLSDAIDDLTSEDL